MKVDEGQLRPDGIRFETPPGKQLQIDFGERRAMIGGENVKVYPFVAALGYSRRLYVRAFHSRQHGGTRPERTPPTMRYFRWRRSL
jgi:transposase